MDANTCYAMILKMELRIAELEKNAGKSNK